MNETLIKTMLFEIVLLGAASQRIEYLALEFIGLPWMLEILADWKEHERGSIPGPTECCIMLFIISESPLTCDRSQISHSLNYFLIDYDPQV